MLKRLSGILAVLLLFSLSLSAFAAGVDISGLTLDELKELKADVEARIDELEGEEKTAQPASGEYPTLQKGDKNDDVKKLQQRLIELNYLSGSADGDYGGKTEKAVSAFQKAAGLKQTGIADNETQQKLYASDAPAVKSYEKLPYDKVSRDPDQYKGKAYQFSGRVLQVMEDDTYADTQGVYTVLRVSSKGRYDNVVYVTYWRPKTESRILEDDKVTVYGVSGGLYTYTSTMGQAITIPLIEADMIN